MFISLNKKKAQSTLEYTIVIAVIVAALIAMQGYFKRGVQGKMRQSTDDIGDQFSPNATTGSVTNAGSVTSADNYVQGVGSNTTTYDNQTRTLNAFDVGVYDDDYWPTP